MDDKVIDIGIGTAKIFDNIIEITINEGITFKTEDLKNLFNLFDTQFPDKKFGYLSNRKNDYSIDLSPALYKAFHANLTATATVCYSDLSFKNAKFEKEFYKHKPFEAFRDYEEAVNWLKTHL